MPPIFSPASFNPSTAPRPPRRGRRRQRVLLVLLLPLLVAGAIFVIDRLRGGPLLAVDFAGQHGLVTNEYAYWHPHSPDAVTSPVWDMTSGSLFARDGVGWSGVPDARPPDSHSTRTNNSAVFRLNTRQRDFGDVTVNFRLRNLGLTATPQTPAQEWDGIHVWLRYQSEYELYYVSANRRDGEVVVKKKVADGPSNGGTYYTLAEANRPVSLRHLATVSASAHNDADGAVRIDLSIDGKHLLTAIDHGSGGPPITEPGAVGIRGDNCNFEFDRFEVTD